ncbi:hypothetical protein Ocin01_12088 [Orchesella cincta]|uniref:Uncharacterized protein n=1 Tax=Orchesella cincta TaxID=48709 RepID=A0A1D2MNN6_ORCCI|nr:hypothetical protein Ocin01_12088 [Orchesella cincta]
MAFHMKCRALLSLIMSVGVFSGMAVLQTSAGFIWTSHYFGGWLRICIVPLYSDGCGNIEISLFLERDIKRRCSEIVPW